MLNSRLGTRCGALRAVLCGLRRRLGSRVLGWGPGRAAIGLDLDVGAAGGHGGASSRECKIGARGRVVVPTRADSVRGGRARRSTPRTRAPHRVASRVVLVTLPASWAGLAPCWPLFRSSVLSGMSFARSAPAAALAFAGVGPARPSRLVRPCAALTAASLRARRDRGSGRMSVACGQAVASGRCCGVEQPGAPPPPPPPRGHLVTTGTGVPRHRVEPTNCAAPERLRPAARRGGGKRVDAPTVTPAAGTAPPPPPSREEGSPWQLAPTSRDMHSTTARALAGRAMAGTGRCGTGQPTRHREPEGVLTR